MVYSYIFAGELTESEF